MVHMMATLAFPTANKWVGQMADQRDHSTALLTVVYLVLQRAHRRELTKAHQRELPLGLQKETQKEYPMDHTRGVHWVRSTVRQMGEHLVLQTALRMELSKDYQRVGPMAHLTVHQMASHLVPRKGLLRAYRMVPMSEQSSGMKLATMWVQKRELRWVRQKELTRAQVSG